MDDALLVILLYEHHSKEVSEIAEYSGLAENVIKGILYEYKILATKNNVKM